MNKFAGNPWQGRRLLWQHFRQPFGTGSLERSDAAAEAFDSSRSQQLRVEISLVCQHIEEARFKAFGGVVLLACGSWLCEWLAGKNLALLQQLKSGELVELLSSQLELQPAERPLAFLAEDIVLQLAETIESTDSGKE